MNRILHAVHSLAQAWSHTHRLRMGLLMLQSAGCVGVFIIWSLNLARSEISVASEPVDLCTITKYQRLLRALRCNQTNAQQLADMYLNCGYNKMARRELVDCGVMNGDFCLNLAEDAHRYRDAADAQCFDVYGKPSCSDDCRSALKDFRENVGCCINNLYNVSDSPIYNDRAASYILWGGCGVKPVDGLCKSTIDYVVIYDTPVCVSDEVNYRRSRLECHPGYGQSFADLFRLCGYTAQLRYAVNLCGVNDENRYCFELLEAGKEIADEVNKYCVQATESDCPLSCKIALDSYKRKLGCCLNNLYNNEENQYFRTTSPTLWTACQMDRPRFCKTTISLEAGSPKLHFSFILITLSLFGVIFCFNS